MARRRRLPDYAIAFAALAPPTRVAIRHLEAQLALPTNSWPAVPPLRLLVAMLAAMRGADDAPAAVRLSGHAFRDAAELFLPDDPDTKTHAAAGLERTLRRWRAAADKLTAHPRPTGATLDP